MVVPPWLDFCFLFDIFSLHSFWFIRLFWDRVFPSFPVFPFSFLTMNRLYKRTVVLDGSGFPDNVKVDDIPSKIVDCFGSVNVLSVQFMLGRAIRVTFENEPFLANVIRESSVTVDNVVCSLRGSGPRAENVLIFRYPFEADSAPLKGEISKMGRYMRSVLGHGPILIMSWMVPGSSV